MHYMSALLDTTHISVSLIWMSKFLKLEVPAIVIHNFLFPILLIAVTMCLLIDSSYTLVDYLKKELSFLVTGTS